MKGIILAGGSGTRLWPITKGISKQLVPVYDKPMIYYPLSTLIQAQIKDILLITTPTEADIFKRLLEGIEITGINLKYATQEKPEGLAQAFTIAHENDFISEYEPVSMILGDNIFIGEGMRAKLSLALENANKGKANIFCYEVSREAAKSLGIAVLDENNKVLEIEEKPANPKSNNCVTGLYIYGKDAVFNASTLTKSARGELEITDLNKKYLEKNQLNAVVLNNDNYKWVDTGQFDNLNDASNLVRIIEEKCDTLIGSPEKEAYLNGWMKEEDLAKTAEVLSKSSYGKRLQKLL